jgi:uncharacterized protein
MNNSIPGFIDPHKLAKTGQALQDKVAVADLNRAKKLLSSESGEIKYQLVFTTDAEGYCVISGKLGSILTVRCQRCLKEFQQSIESDFVVSPVNDDAGAKALPSSYEAVYTADGKLYPIELIEDELILALPIVPLHEFDSPECVALTKAQEAGSDFANPFRVLQDINVNKNSQQAEDK